MPDTLLQSLRERVIDETASTAGLLRKCLLLGAESGSESLRAWARSELNGYEAESELPEFRKLVGAPLTMDSISGNYTTTGQTVAPIEVPPKARQFLLDTIEFRQPIEELAILAERKSVSLTQPALAYVQNAWNSELGPFQQVTRLYYSLPGARLTGILGQVRTTLVDLVADLTAATPLTDLPGKAAVDAAVTNHIGTIHNTTVVSPAGPVAIGAAATANQGLTIDDVLQLLGEARSQTGELSDEESTAVLAAVDDLTAAVSAQQRDTGVVVERAGILTRLSEKAGSAALTTAVSAAVTGLTKLALSGALH